MSKERSEDSFQHGPESHRHGGKFAVTSWTEVVAAGERESPEAHHALENLCHSYWRPLHDYVRRLGYSEEDTEDLTQEFFLRLVSKNMLAAADRRKGKFRTFLLTSLKNFLTNEWHRARAAKRGGGQVMVSLDEEVDGEKVHQGPVNELSPEDLYEKSWAQRVVQQARDRLGDEYDSAGKLELFSHLKAFLEGAPAPRAYQAVAPKLKMTANAVGVVVHRMRQRLGELIRSEIQRTLVDPTAKEVDGEMRFLLETLGR